MYAACRGSEQTAVRLLGAAAARRAELGLFHQAADRVECDQVVEAMRSRLADQAVAAARAQGQELSLEQALALARTVL